MSKLTEIIELRASSAQLVGTETGTAQKLDQPWDEFTFFLDVTAQGTESNDTLDVYIDTSFDGGTSWVNIGHFTQILGNGSAAKHLIFLDKGTSDEIPVTSEVAAGSVRSIGMGDRFRHRGVVVDPTGSNGTFTYSLAAFLKNNK